MTNKSGWPQSLDSCKPSEFPSYQIVTSNCQKVRIAKIAAVLFFLLKEEIDGILSNSHQIWIKLQIVCNKWCKQSNCEWC